MTQNKKQKNYKQVWEDNWKDICENPDGTLNKDAIQRELSDYDFLLDNVPKVYEHVSGFRLSKPNYHADVVIGQFEEAVQEQFKKYLEEIIETVTDISEGFENMSREDLIATIEEIKEFIKKY